MVEPPAIEGQSLAVSAPLVIVDEVGYVPFDPEAAKLMFLLVSSRWSPRAMSGPRW